MKRFAIILAFVSISVITISVNAQTSDAALRRAIEADTAARLETQGKLPTLSAAEHLSRAETYMANRMFPQAREHWAKVMETYPADAGIPKALFGTARSYMWERDYLKAVEWFDKLTKDHLNTKDGREGLAFKGASYVRAGKNLEAAKVYEQYVTMFPEGEKIESAHLNIIDAYREAGEYQKAGDWSSRTAARFAGKPTEANALQSKVRMEIHRGRWNDAVAAADTLIAAGSFRGSMTSLDEAKYLKALALEKSGKDTESKAVYRSIPHTMTSYFGGLAAEKLAGGRVDRIASVTPRLYTEYPIMFTADVLKYAKANKIDPRFVLAIMKQESSFKPAAKSPAGARGLVQLVYDTAIKYKDKAGYPRLQPDDLYVPAVNISIGSIYIAELKDEFDGMYEAIAASYNAGEDNSARWLARSKPKEPGVFASEVGFAETKNYVFKVMNNYRVYRELYDENLKRR
jgi:soluble lytic murein transglycosylase-like protein/outer membrane protein assembly factor BamD (BamD/ComL family)